MEDHGDVEELISAPHTPRGGPPPPMPRFAAVASRVQEPFQRRSDEGTAASGIAGTSSREKGSSLVNHLSILSSDGGSSRSVLGPVSHFVRFAVLPDAGDGEEGGEVLEEVLEEPTSLICDGERTLTPCMTPPTPPHSAFYSSFGDAQDAYSPHAGRHFRVTSAASTEAASDGGISIESRVASRAAQRLRAHRLSGGSGGSGSEVVEEWIDEDACEIVAFRAFAGGVLALKLTSVLARGTSSTVYDAAEVPLSLEQSLLSLADEASSFSVSSRSEQLRPPSTENVHSGARDGTGSCCSGSSAASSRPPLISVKVVLCQSGRAGVGGLRPSALQLRRHSLQQRQHHSKEGAEESPAAIDKDENEEVVESVDGAHSKGGNPGEVGGGGDAAEVGDNGNEEQQPDLAARAVSIALNFEKVGMLKRELATLSRLVRHHRVPGILPYLGVYQRDEWLFIAMRQCAGGCVSSLLDRLQHGLPLLLLERFALTLLRGLAATHRAQLTHRTIDCTCLLIDVDADSIEQPQQQQQQHQSDVVVAEAAKVDIFLGGFSAQHTAALAGPALPSPSATSSTTSSPALHGSSAPSLSASTSPAASPRGRPSHKAADVWALSCSLLEMLIGRPLHEVHRGRCHGPRSLHAAPAVAAPRIAPPLPTAADMIGSNEPPAVVLDFFSRAFGIPRAEGGPPPSAPATSAESLLETAWMRHAAARDGTSADISSAEAQALHHVISVVKDRARTVHAGRAQQLASIDAADLALTSQLIKTIHRPSLSPQVSGHLLASSSPRRPPRAQLRTLGEAAAAAAAGVGGSTGESPMAALALPAPVSSRRGRIAISPAAAAAAQRRDEPPGEADRASSGTILVAPLRPRDKLGDLSKHRPHPPPSTSLAPQPPPQPGVSSLITPRRVLKP